MNIKFLLLCMTKFEDVFVKTPVAHILIGVWLWNFATVHVTMDVFECIKPVYTWKLISDPDVLNVR